MGGQEPKKVNQGEFFQNPFHQKAPPPIKQGALKSSAVIKKQTPRLKKNSVVEKKLRG